MIQTKILAATGQVEAKECYYHGGVLYDLTGDAVVLVYKGTSAVAANLIDVLSATDENQTDRSNIPAQGIYCKTGFYATKTNGDNLLFRYEVAGGA